MKGFFPIFKRELFAIFLTPLAWVLIVVFLLVEGLHFLFMVDRFTAQLEVVEDQGPIQAFFGNTVLLYLVLFLLVPPITMRLFAEERRTGTIETLMTAPVSSAAVVLAKYAAALTTFFVMWAPTLLYVVILRRTGEIDWRVVGSCYAGVGLVGAAYLAIGLLASALTKSQFLALIYTALAILLLFVIGIAELVSHEGTLLHAAASHVSVWAHMNDFSLGIIDSRRLVFYGTLITLPLFLATRTVEAWRWSS